MIRGSGEWRTSVVCRVRGVTVMSIWRPITYALLFSILSGGSSPPPGFDSSLSERASRSCACSTSSWLARSKYKAHMPQNVRRCGHDTTSGHSKYLRRVYPLPVTRLFALLLLLHFEWPWGKAKWGFHQSSVRKVCTSFTYLEGDKQVVQCPDGYL